MQNIHHIVIYNSKIERSPKSSTFGVFKIYTSLIEWNVMKFVRTMQTEATLENR